MNTRGEEGNEDDEVAIAEEGDARDQTAGLPAVIDSDFGRMIQDTRSRAVEDPEAVAEDITRRILAAQTVEDVLAPQQARHARELLDVPILVHGLHFNESDFEEGVGFYAIVDVTDPETGDEFAVACGGRNVMAQLYRLAQLGAFPAKVKFTQAKRPTAKGFWPLWLVAAS